MMFDQLHQRMRQAESDILARATVRLYEAATAVQRASQKICPVDTGNLRRSCYTTLPARRGSRIETTVGYTANYAIYVHENLRAYHKPPTRAKYLESVMKELAPHFDRIISGHIRARDVLQV